jgi:hypothetical protein
VANIAAERLISLFAGRADAHGTHDEPQQDGLKWGIKRSARTLREPVTVALWEDHLAGRRPLGVIPIREDSTCSWGSIDDDDYERDHLETIHRVESLGFPLVPCWSKSGGLHLFLFLAEPAPAGMIQTALRTFAARLGLAGCEIFPKQTNVIPGDFGNWMVMPYYGSTFGGKIREQVGVRNTGDQLSVEEFLDLAERSRQVPGDIEARAAASAGGARTTRQARRPPGGPPGVIEIVASSSEGPFADGPPCLQHLSATKVGRGGQNNFMLMVGIYAKKKFPEDWENQLEDANREFLDPPGTAAGVTSVVRSLQKKDYEYTCRAEPMCSHCDAVLCRTRKYGVGGGRTSPPIVAIRKLDSDPPHWYVDVDHAEVGTLTLTTDELLYYNKFQFACMEKKGVLFLGMKQMDWTKFIASFEITTVEAAPEIGRPGEFKEYLDQFLVNRWTGTRKEDLAAGKPWEDQDAGLFYFRLSDLHEFLKERGRMPKMERRDIAELVKKMGGEANKQLWRGGPRMWCVPSSVVDRPQKLALPAPKEQPV